MLFFRKVNGGSKVNPEDDASSIGNLAIELGFITKEDLLAAILVQQTRLPLGEILIEMGKLNEDQLSELLFEQRVRRGEVKNEQQILEHQQKRKRRRLKQVQRGFREVREDSQKLADSLYDLVDSVKVKAE